MAKQLKERNPTQYKEVGTLLWRWMGVVGILGVLEVLADLLQEMGDGKGYEPDPFWLSAAAQIEAVRENLKQQAGRKP